MPEILPGVHIIPESDGVAGPAGPINICLLTEGTTATLVDAGLPGSAPAILAYLEQIGRRPSDMRRVIVTHHHVDHVGGLAEIVRLTGAEVWAHGEDTGTIEGRISRAPIPPERVQALLQSLPADQREATAARVTSINDIEPAAVDLRLCGDEQLRLLGGVRILHTPGHTAGHLCLYLPALSLLIAGDLLRLVDGVIKPSPARNAADADLALASAKTAAALRFDKFVGYHGGYAVSGAAGLLAGDLCP